jgi:hypothetical protein
MSEFMIPEQSYSRELDMKVQREEKPYGYTENPPPADSGDYDMRKYNSKKEYPVRDRNG